jgi:hypothetical protein
MDAVALALRLTLAVVCGWAAAGKLFGQTGRRETVRMLRGVGVPRVAAPSAAVALVVAELAVAALSPLPATGLVGAGAAVLLFSALTAGVARSVRRGDRVTCACFGSRGKPLAGVHVVRNAVLTAIAAAAVPVTALAPGRAPQPAAALAAVAVALAVALLTRYAEDLAALFRQPDPAYSKGLP